MKKILNVIIIFLVIIFISNIIINYPEIRDYINIRVVDDKNNKSLRKLKKQNKNVLFKIKIPDTHINYPVIRSKDNSFYLNHDINGDFNQYGAIFVDYREYYNTFSFKNLIIYGHNMGRLNKLMFGDLMGYLNFSFLSTHRNVYIYKRKKKEVYQVISVFKVKNDFTPYEIAFDSDSSYLDWQKNIISKSLLKGLSNNFSFSTKNKFITLSTCTYGDGSEKLVVIARLL